jgi:hypothetical protein
MTNAEWVAKKVTFQLPRFDTTIHSLCPLSYSLSKEDATAFTDFNITEETGNKIQMLVPFDEEAPTTKTFFIDAENTYEATGQSPEFVLELNPCGNELVNIEGEQAFSMDVNIDEGTDPTIVSFLNAFESNRSTSCPVTTYSLEMASNATLTEDEALLFSLDSEAQKISIAPLTYGEYKLYLKAETASGQQNYIEYSINIYSCTQEYAELAVDFSSLQ